MLRAVIIDDEPAGIITLKLLIGKQNADMRVVASATEPEEGIRLIEDYKPDVVFLDISMPTMNGFEMLERLTFKEFKLVFTTAHKEFAIEAIKNKAFDYLLKPINPTELKNCISNIITEADQKKPGIKNDHVQTLEISVKDGIIYIKQNDIIRLEASGSYTVFYLEGNVKHLASKSIKEYEAHLDTRIFYRCHNSHIVNLLKVKKFVNHEGFFAQMNDGSMADISKKHKDIFLEKIKTL